MHPSGEQPGKLLQALKKFRDGPRLALAATLAVGIALSAGAAHWQTDNNAALAQRRFETVAGEAVSRLKDRLETYEYGLQGARGVVLAHEAGMIGSAAFTRYVDSLDIDRQFPGLRGLGVAWRVAPADEAAFVAQRRQDGDPDFSVRQLSPQDGDRYVSALAAPRERTRSSIGVDIASEERRRSVADTAMRAGSTSISAPIRLFGTSGQKQASFLLMLPIYRRGAAVATVEERVAASVGWTVSALLLDKALADVGLEDSHFSVSLQDPGSSDVAPFFSTAGADLAAVHGIAQRIELPVYGRTWAVDVRARPMFLDQLDLPDPRVTGAVLGLLTTALALLMHTLARGRQRAQQVLNEQARRAAIVAGSNDAIICQSMDGVVTDWNAGAERLFGHDAAEVVGKPLADLLLPKGRKDEAGGIRRRLTRGDTLAAFDTVRRHRDGSLIDVSIAASPILAADGRCVGVAKTMRDITAVRRAAREMQDLNAGLEIRVAERTALLEVARHDLQSILDALPTAIAYWDRTLHNRFRNQAHYRWFGGDPALGPGTHITEMLGDDYASRQPQVQAALDGVAQTFELESRVRESGAQRHAIIHYMPDVRDGEVQGFYVMAHDVTAAKLTEQRLRASEEFLDRAGAIAGVGGWALDLTTMKLTWSAHTYRIHEIDRDQQPDVAQAIDFYAPEARPVIAHAVEQGIACGTPWDLELALITATGKRLWVRSQGTVDMVDGRAVRLIGAFQDITDRKRAAVHLQQAHDRFAIAADSAHMGVWEYEPVSGTLVWDAHMYRLYGQLPSGPVEPYSLWADALHADDRLRAETALEAALRDDSEYDLDFRIVRPSGEIRHLRANARVMRDTEGAPLRMTGVNIDITDQKRAELDLVQTSSLLQTVLESASEVSIIATDAQLHITIFNAGATRLLGYASEEIVGRATFALLHDAEEMTVRAAELSEQLGRPVAGDAVFTEPEWLGQPRLWTYLRKDGSRVRISLIVTAMHAADGSLLGYLGIAHDVTRQQEYEDTLRDATRKAAHASVAKSQFLANMSHEIRTPMNAVIGLTYLLGQSGLDAQQSDMVDKLQIAGKSLLGIINDVLDLSKIEAGELTLEQTPFTLRGVLKDLKALMSVQARAKGIRFSIDTAGDLPTALDGDAPRLGQVLTNLVANAIKFTDRGGVKLSVGRWIDSEAQALPDDRLARLRFTVRDSGIGIPPEVQGRLFTPFVQADSSTKRRFGGTGLGLSIVKRLVSLMGGRIGLESEPGVGSTFWVEVALPVPDVPVSSPAPLPTSASRDLRGVRVLITDDSDINLEIAGRILMRQGAQITLAHDGQQAVDLLQKRPDAFDVVLMDVQMPVLDGHEATQRIRNDLGLTALPIIALTAGVLTQDVQGAGGAGMNDFVIKPFDAQNLVRVVLRHARPLAVAAVPAAALPVGDRWPEIVGIDTADVRARLGGDLALFGSMLRRLLREFSDTGAEPGSAVGAPGAALDALAARMHKLKGSASTLGATSISRLADLAETACRGGQPAHAQAVTQKLAAQLKALSEDACRVLDLMQAMDGSPVGPVATVAAPPRQRLTELIGLLNENSIAALDRFRELAPQLRERLSDPEFRMLQDRIDNLQFQEAVSVLESLTGRIVGH